MFESNELKVQLATGHEFYAKKKFLVSITFAPGIEHVVDCYVIDKLTMPIILGMQWI